VLTTGGTTTFAVCLACERRGGSSLSRGWGVVLGWLLKPILALLVALVVLYLLFGESAGR
jgi:phosphate/sulfate permease